MRIIKATFQYFFSRKYTYRVLIYTDICSQKLSIV